VSLYKPFLIWKIISGHAPLNYHLHRIGKAQSPMCSCNLAEESAWYFIFDCPNHNVPRSAFKSAVLLITRKWPPHPSIYNTNPADPWHLSKFSRTVVSSPAPHSLILFCMSIYVINNPNCTYSPSISITRSFSICLYSHYSVCLVLGNARPRGYALNIYLKKKSSW
jgi:hypothetical protein